MVSLPTFDAEHVDGRLMFDGYVLLEYELELIVESFARNNQTSGEIVSTHVHERALREAHDDAEIIQEASLLANMQPGRFARVAQSHAFPLPTDSTL